MIVLDSALPDGGNPPVPVLLMIDTSGPATSVALVDQGRCFNIHLDAAQHSAHVFKAIDAVLAAAVQTPAALDGIVFGHGPGSFTGVRIACCVAQGMAMGCGIPVLGIDSALSLAVQVQQRLKDMTEGPAPHTISVATLQDARMQECFAAVYRWTPAGGWERRRAPVLLATSEATRWLSAVAAQADPSVQGLQVACDTLAHLPNELRQPGQPWHCHELGQPRAADFFSWAHARWRAGDFQAPDTARPLYVRDKVAFTLAERIHGSGGNPRLSDAPA